MYGKYKNIKLSKQDNAHLYLLTFFQRFTMISRYLESSDFGLIVRPLIAESVGKKFLFTFCYFNVKNNGIDAECQIQEVWKIEAGANADDEKSEIEGITAESENSGSFKFCIFFRNTITE